MLKIAIETIPYTEQRYPTVGDWYWKEEVELTPQGSQKHQVLHIKVSELSDWRREAMIAVHELIEVLLCKNDGVTQDQVDKFDMEFEKRREERIFEASRTVSEPGVKSAEEAMIEIEEPGDHLAAPYSKQHCFATATERMLCAAFGISWADYEKEIESLP